MNARRPPLPCPQCSEPKEPGRGKKLCNACALVSVSTKPDRLRRTNKSAELRRRYGISLDQYEAAMIAQNDVCAVCYQPCRTGDKLCVDHDHTTGAVRGLLCRRCNAGLGYLEDAAWMAAAASFLATPPGIPRVCRPLLADTTAVNA